MATTIDSVLADAAADAASFVISQPLAYCPHVPSNVSDDVPDPAPPLTCCQVDGCDATDVAVCMQCWAVMCGRSANGHMLDHHRERGHEIVTMVADLMVWCYGCDESLDFFKIPELHAGFDCLHRAKFGEPAQLPSATALAEAAARAAEADSDDSSTDDELVVMKGVEYVPQPTVTRSETTGLAYDPAMMKHECVRQHPEQPLRIKRIFDKLTDAGLADRCVRIPVRPATVEELEALHTSSYTSLVVDELPSWEPRELRQRAAGWNSVYLNPHSPSAALLAAGGTLAVTEAVATGEAGNGVAVVRPPGHHAEAHCAMGFCLFNNVALAAKAAVDKWGMERVLIVDWDVHHGNGTQNMFIRDPSVLYVSLHRYDDGMFFPGDRSAASGVVGVGDGAGYNVNIAWNLRDEHDLSKKLVYGDAEYLSAFSHVIMPVAREYDPQLVLVSAGFDAARGDPLGGLDVTPAGYAHMMHELTSLAGGKVVMVLEGGYNLHSISESFAAATSVLLGDRPQPVGALKPNPQALKSIGKTAEALSPHWVVFGNKRAAEEVGEVGEAGAGAGEGGEAPAVAAATVGAGGDASGVSESKS